MRAYGIDIGGTFIKAGILDGQTVTAHLKEPSPHDPEQMAERVVSMLKALGWNNDAPVGVACAGGVSTDGRVYCDNLGWQNGVPFGRLMAEKGCRGCYILNDAQAALIAEWKLGALKGYNHSILLTFGTGIGSGVIANGRPYEGKDNFGPELGHIITHFRGAKCTCGQEGCWEAYASAGALSRACDGLSARVIFENLKLGKLTKQFEGYMDEVAVGVISCLSAFAPEIVAFGGGLSNAGDAFLNGILAALHRYPGYDRMYTGIELTLAKFQNDAGVIGSSLHALEQTK